MGKVKTCILCAAFCFSFLNPGFSETILLKSGQKVEGRIIEKTGKYVKLAFQGVELVYYNDEIASIEQAPASSADIVNPQLESLYQAYLSSLNPPEQTKAEKAQNIVPASQQQWRETSKEASMNVPTPGLSQLPPEYRKIVEAALQKVKGAQSGQAVSSNPTSAPAEVDLSKLPPEYQKMIKSTMDTLKPPNSKPTEKKQNTY